MNILNTKRELWLLNLMAIYGIYVESVYGTPQGLQELWNSRVPGFDAYSPEDVIVPLQHLLAKEEIKIVEKIKGVDGESLSKQQQRKILRDIASIKERSYVYVITKKGIDRWTNHYQPDWSRFWNTSGYTNKVDREVEIYISGSQAHLLDMLEFCFDLNHWDRRAGLNRLVISRKPNWKATYWKRLPMAYIANFEVTELPVKYPFTWRPTQESREVFSNWLQTPPRAGGESPRC